MKKTIEEKLGGVSQLGFGAMRLPKFDGKIDQDETNAMVKYAFDNGVNYFDTAYVYDDGDSERALGKALKQLNREDFFVADKLPFWDDSEPNFMEKMFNISLERLGVDYFDFYLLHSMTKPTLEKVKKHGALEFVLEKKRQGKIKHIGFSIHDDVECLKQMFDLYDGWEFVQIQLNYLDLDGQPGDAGYQELVRRGVPIIIMEPLKGGLLADLPATIAEPYRKLSGNDSSFSFRWLAEKPGIAVILSGMSTMEQMQQNTELFNNITPLSEAEHAAIAEVGENVKKYQKVPCTTCAYCMPCPIGIDIPETFKAWNTKHLNTGNENWISGTFIDYNMASSCVECNSCTKHCPQQIDIPAKLKELIAEGEAG